MKLDAPGLMVADVRLDPLKEAHRDLLEASGAVEAMWNWMPVIATGTNFHTYFDHTLSEAKEGRILPFAITRVSDGAFAGVAAYLSISRTHRRLRIGYRWHPETMRGGLISAATSLALIARARESRIQRIEFLIDIANQRAIHSIEQIPAVREGVLRHYLRAASGVWADMAIYALIGTEIDTAIMRLEARVNALQAAKA